MNSLSNNNPEQTVKINTDQMLMVLQFGGDASISTLEEHVQTNFKKTGYDAALGLQVLVELKRDFPLTTKYDSKVKANKVIIPSSVHLLTYVNRAIEFFDREENIKMKLQPIGNK